MLAYILQMNRVYSLNDLSHDDSTIPAPLVPCIIIIIINIVIIIITVVVFQTYLLF